jgi:hypothetical protein
MSTVYEGCSYRFSDNRLQGRFLQYFTVVRKISDQNYEQSFAFCCFWFDIGRIYHQIPPDPTLNTILDNRAGGSVDPRTLISSRIVYHDFTSEAESDRILAPHDAGLQSRLCTRFLQEFFNSNLRYIRNKEQHCWSGESQQRFRADANIIAHWANLGYVEETAIRNHILQSLISHPLELYEHQADALIVLLKVAGATFEAYANPSVDHCFELFKNHCRPSSVHWEAIQVRAFAWWKAVIGLRYTFRN